MKGFTAKLTLVASAALALGLAAGAQAATAVDGRLIPTIEWDTKLEKFQFDHDKFLGQRFTAFCPAAPKHYSADADNTDSFPSKQALCDAGFRASEIDRSGGIVTVQLNSGMSIADSLERPGVAGSARAIVVVSDNNAEAVSALQSESLPRIKWDTKFTATGMAYKQLLGQHLRFDCPAAPADMRARRVVGTDHYAFSSMVCRAAIHAGKITTDGGTVTVQLNPQQKRLTGSIRNGMETSDGSSGLRALSFVD